MVKVLIADDEPKIRKALKIMLNSVDSEIEIAGEAEDGTDVLYMVENLKPDVLFLDIVMPKTDGLTILEKLRENKCNTKVIIISGYNDFAYAKKAISYDVVEYILKPFDLNDVSNALNKAIHKIRTEEAYITTQIRLQQISKEEVYRKNKELLHKIYYGNKLSDVEIDSIAHCGSWKVFLLVVKDYNKILEEQFKKDSEILSFCISKFSEEVLVMNSKNYLTAISHRYGQMCWMAVSDSQSCEKNLKSIRLLYKEYLKLECFICYTEKSYKVEELSQQINKLEEIVFHINLTDIAEMDGILRVEDVQIKPINDRQLELINKAVREVNHIIRHSLYFSIKPLIDGIYKFAMEQNMLSVHFLFTVYSSFKSEMDNLIPDISGMEVGIIERNVFSLYILFDGQKAYKLLVDMITNGIEGYKALKQGTAASGRVEAIKEYINISFMENLSLESLAVQFFISKQYLANRFKALTGVTVLDYIHSKRLMKAAEMLTSSEVQVSDIATLVGYDSISYFNKLFRREFGLTPTEYRDRKVKES